MLLKTRESQTKYTNFERLFRRKCAGFAIFETNCAGFARFEAHQEVNLEDRCPGFGAKRQVPGVRRRRWGAEQAAKSSPPRITTPALTALPLLNQEGSFSGAGMGAFTPRKMPVDAIMYMKKQGLIGHSGYLS
jgi:hypothetical protein